MKTSKNYENDQFLDMPLKHVSGLTGLVNRPVTLKLWAIAHENGQNDENDQFFDMPLKHVSGLKGLVNRPVTLKPWAIAHENGQKLRKRPVFGHASQTCIGSYGPCKSPRNPKTVGNSS